MLLAQLGASLRASPSDVITLGKLLSSHVAFTPLDQCDIAPLRRTGAIRTQRVSFRPTEMNGRAAFLTSWRNTWAPFHSMKTTEMQIISLRVVGQSPLIIETNLRYDFCGAHHSDLREERTGEWTVQWSNQGGQWVIDQWRPVHETRGSMRGNAFVDVTQECLRGDPSYRKQLVRGVDYWRTTLDSACGIDVYGNNGIAVGDFEGHGRDGFYVCQPAGLPNRLYRNRGDGAFEDISERTGLNLLDGTASALFADFTNSGTQDLLVVRTSGPLLFLNTGGGNFELKNDAFQFAKPPGGTFTGVAAADYDRDGLIDIYFCLYAYYQGPSQYTHPMPYYDAQNGPPNFLMKNRGAGHFEDVTDDAGLNQNNNRFTFACGWCDYKGRGWPDLYVANDFGRKNLYRNNGDGTFTDIAAEAGVEDYGAGMSVSWLDYNNDGHPDLYVTDMWSAAGQRVTSQDSFLPGVPDIIRSAYRKHASGNSLFENQSGNKRFSDNTQRSQTAVGRWSWSGDSWDCDHDGHSDLYVTNGFISGANRHDLASFFWRQIVARSLDESGSSLDYELAWNAINELIRADYSWNGYERNVCFLNNNDGTFADVSGLLELDLEDDSRAFGLGDFDGDGRLEIILKNRTAPQVRILRNEMQGIGNSVSFRLTGTKSNRDAIGASVSVAGSSIRQTRYLQAGSGFLSQHTKDLFFGTGPDDITVSVTVRWPDGSQQRFELVPVNHCIAIREGDTAFHATAYRTDRRPSDQLANPSPDNRLPDTFGTWLLEPLRAMPFSLFDTTGQTWTLEQFGGKPLLLLMTASECPRSLQQLIATQGDLSILQSHGIGIAGMSLDGSSKTVRAIAQRAGIRFPLLLADKETSGVYNILYRYLFDRRRALDPPVSFLIDGSGFIVKVYHGNTVPTQICKDWRDAPQTDAERLHHALGLGGQYHSTTPQRNYFTYGIAYIQGEHVDAAITCFQEAIVRNPRYAAAYYNLGTIYLNKQMLPEARKNLEKAVSLDPQDADAWTNLGAIAGQQKNYDEALEYFQQAVKAKPSHLVALQNLVMLYRWQGKIDQAEQVLRNAIERDPNNAEFHFALGILLAGQEHFADARSELERAAQLRPNDSTTLNDLGVVYLRLGRPDDALNTFERCTRMSPDYDRPFLNIALIYQQSGKLEQARKILQAFAGGHPDNQDVTKALADLEH